MMERKGVCCLAPRYGPSVGAGGQASMSWQMGRIMLKFRPIAPKPAAMAPAPTPALVMTGVAGRGKRKAVSRGGGRRGRKPKEAKVATATPVMATATATATAAVPKASSDKDREKKSLSSPSSSSSGITCVDSSPPPPATLPLMPVAPVENGKEKVAAAPEPPPVAPAYAAGQVVAPRALRPEASWVTVEDVTGTWRDGEAPSAAACGPWDEAPAFVSDQWGRVSWTNAAFNRAVSGGGDDEAAVSEVRVGLAAKGGGAATVPAWGTCAGFTCRVRVRHACPRRSSLVAPCDVWCLDAGGYLWRLDLQAALSLGALP